VVLKDFKFRKKKRVRKADGDHAEEELAFATHAVLMK